MMGTGDGEREADRFVREWLGRLLDYDARHHTELVDDTLALSGERRQLRHDLGDAPHPPQHRPLPPPAHPRDHRARPQ